MMKKQDEQRLKLAPKLRFKGFTDDWEQRKIKDLALESIGGGTPSTKTRKFWHGEIPWIQSSDIQEDSIELYNFNKFITSEAIENSSAKLIKSNSIAIVTRVGVGKVSIIHKTYSSSQDFLNLIDVQGDINFVAQLIKNAMNKEKRYLQGTSIKGIPNKMVLNKKLLLLII